MVCINCRRAKALQFVPQPTGSHLKIFQPNPSASISESCKISSVDDRPSEKDSLSHFQSDKSGIFFEEPPSEVESDHSSVQEDSNGSILKSGIYVDNPSEEDDDESSHSVQKNSKETPLKSAGIFVDQPPS